VNDIEAIIVLILLFMVVPDACRRLGRPALAYPVFVLFGFALGLGVDEGLKTMLTQAGQVGFLLLLFEVGLEIELPKPRELVKPLGWATLWALAQYPAILAVASLAGLRLAEGFVAAAALTACSVGIAHAAWKDYPLPDSGVRAFVLRVMVLLEVLAILLLAVETVVLRQGFSWSVPLRLLGIALTVLLVTQFAPHLAKLFQLILDKTTRWRTHLLVLLVLVICAIGQRLGLSAAKTAFVLGLALSRARHEGLSLEEWMAPISQRFLIPVFFVALGILVRGEMLLGWGALLALGTAGLVIGLREVLHRRWFRTGGDVRTFLLVSPNLTLVALAVTVLVEHGSPQDGAAWLLLTGLFISVAAIFLLPKGPALNPSPTGMSTSAPR
jgi:Kef-type K+ transport system membrane component KefB